jgi:hypothetical protein
VARAWGVRVCSRQRSAESGFSPPSRLRLATDWRYERTTRSIDTLLITQIRVAEVCNRPQVVGEPVERLRQRPRSGCFT